MVMVPCPGLSCGSVKHAKSSISFCCCAAAMVFKAFFFFFLSLLGERILDLLVESKFNWNWRILEIRFPRS